MATDRYKEVREPFQFITADIAKEIIDKSRTIFHDTWMTSWRHPTLGEIYLKGDAAIVKRYRAGPIMVQNECIRVEGTASWLVNKTIMDKVFSLHQQHGIDIIPLDLQ